ncbi:cytokine receptor-like factor 1 [Antedon mediterranea]|uniref:cytokine receptor-like factor 1 n=1 Tax=Antedon mediterranea TaxID=105859 RepID=UPI003AF4F286
MLKGKLQGYQVTLWKNDSQTISEQYNVSSDKMIIREMSMFEQFYISVVVFNSIGKTEVMKKQINTIAPLNPILHAGSDLNISCTLNISATYKSRNITWTTSFQPDTDRIDPSEIDILSDKVSMLRLQNLTMANYKYYCYLPNSLWHATTLHIGMAPTTKPTLNCFSTNIVDYWCEWSKIEFTNLRDTYIFEYKYETPDSLIFLNGSPWRTCPEYVGQFKCNVPLQDDDGNYFNPGTNHRIRVTVTNYLGNVSTQRSFNPDMAAIPFPPRIKKVERKKRSLEINVELQPDITHYKNTLRYQIRYCKNHTDDNWTEDSDDYRYYDTITISKLEPYTQYNLQARSQFKYREWSDWGPTYQGQIRENIVNDSRNSTDGTELHIVAPTKPILTCSSTDAVNYVCVWSKVEDTNLVETYIFEYEHKQG